MKLFTKKLLLTGAILASSLTTTLSHATPFAYEARSLGMGNIGVVTADIATAPFANPAMLAYQKQEDDFQVLITGGFILDDSDGLVDAIDNFQSKNDILVNALTLSTDPIALGSVTQAFTNITAQINALNNVIDPTNGATIGLQGKALSPAFGGGVVIGFAGEDLSFAVSARQDLIAAGSLSSLTTGTIANVTQASTGDPVADAITDANTLLATETSLSNLNNSINNPMNNILNLEGIQTNEVGLSIAGNFHIFGQKMSIGITPKVIDVNRTSFSESVVTLDTGVSSLTGEDATTNLGSVSTVDAGVVVQLTESIQVGLAIKNLVENELIDATDGATVTLATTSKVGIAYRGDFFTLGIDQDLAETDAILSSAAFTGRKTKLLNVGAEFDIKIAQLRVGMQKNTASGLLPGQEDQLTTVGLGFWLGFNLDVAAVVGEDVAGAVVQAGFKF